MPDHFHVDSLRGENLHNSPMSTHICMEMKACLLALDQIYRIWDPLVPLLMSIPGVRREKKAT